MIERALGLRRREAPQAMGMLLDYIPEAIALGGLVVLGAGHAALLIGLQNLLEGFNAFRELHALGVRSARRTLLIMGSLVAIGPAAGLAGYVLLADFPAVLGAIMLFASGGILYLVFQDIAPQSRLNRHWAPPLGAVVGFSMALFGTWWCGATEHSIARLALRHEAVLRRTGGLLPGCGAPCPVHPVPERVTHVPWLGVAAAMRPAVRMIRGRGDGFRWRTPLLFPRCCRPHLRRAAAPIRRKRKCHQTVTVDPYRSDR